MEDERGFDFLIDALENSDTAISSTAQKILVELNHPKGKDMPQDKFIKDAHFSNKNQLPGFPGYRTREGRSGYDPLDSNRESAFMEGSFFRNLFTFRLRTHNIFYLVMMFIFGVIPFAVMLWATVEILISDALEYGDFGLLVLPAIITLITGILAINFLLSILEIKKIIQPLNTNHLKTVKEDKKKTSKRRKDFQ